MFGYLSAIGTVAFNLSRRLRRLGNNDRNPEAAKALKGLSLIFLFLGDDDADDILRDDVIGRLQPTH